MNRYIGFTKESRTEITKCFALANSIWSAKHGGQTTPEGYGDVRILAGNFAGYGRYIANYMPSSKIIEIPLNPSFETIKLTTDGIIIKDLERFKGILLHELAHHFVHHILPNRRDDLNIWDLTAGHSTHTNSDWCHVCTEGWIYFDESLCLMSEDLARGIRKKVPGLAAAMAAFDPYNPPYEILKQIPREDGYNKECQYCKTSFVSKREDARFCSAKCRVAWNRKNKKIELKK